MLISLLGKVFRGFAVYADTSADLLAGNSSICGDQVDFQQT